MLKMFDKPINKGTPQFFPSSCYEAHELLEECLKAIYKYEDVPRSVDDPQIDFPKLSGYDAQDFKGNVQNLLLGLGLTCDNLRMIDKE